MTEIERQRPTLQQRRLAQDAFPISDALLESLFRGCGGNVENSGCEHHTLQFTRSWIVERKQPEAEILYGCASTVVLRLRSSRNPQITGSKTDNRLLPNPSFQRTDEQPCRPLNSGP